MTCPFGHGSSLRQTQQLALDMQARDAAGHASPDSNGSVAPAPASAPASSSVSPPATSPDERASPSMFSPPLGSQGGPSRLPLSLWTGGLRTSLGVENAHPISVWMKEMQARGGLKGIDIEKELLGFESSGAMPTVDESAPGVRQPTQLEQLDDIARAQSEKNWKQKRERPPFQLNSNASSAGAMHSAGSAAGAAGIAAASTPTHPSQLHFFPGLFREPLDHNSHQDQSPMSKYDQEITYWNYIHPEVLISLQRGRQGKGLNHHDEHLFILVHQVFELWFKQILWELEYVRNSLIGYRDPLLPNTHEMNPLARMVQRLNRADKIMRLATEGYAIMETMDPADFLEFRDFLSPSSGFQSVQLREMEILLGLKDEERLACAGRHYREAFMANGDNKTPIFDMRLRQHTLKDGLYIWLRTHLPSTRLKEFLEAYFAVITTQNQEKSKDFEEEMALLEKMRARTSDARELSYLNDLTEKAKFGRTLARNSSEDVRLFFSDPLLGQQRVAILYLFTYHTHSKCHEAAALVNGFLLFEQAVLLWRQRHARMVEMFIGRRPGTGGSSGVEYIDNTAQQYRIFADLWRIRSLCVARSKLAFDPDEGAVLLPVEKFDTDLARVEAAIRAETHRIKEAAGVPKGPSRQNSDSSKATAAATAATAAKNANGSAAGDAIMPAGTSAAAAPSHEVAAGELANSSTSIAAGIGPGAGPGESAN